MSVTPCQCLGKTSAYRKHSPRTRQRPNSPSPVHCRLALVPRGSPFPTSFVHRPQPRLGLYAWEGQNIHESTRRTDRPKRKHLKYRAPVSLPRTHPSEVGRCRWTVDHHPRDSPDPTGGNTSPPTLPAPGSHGGFQRHLCRLGSRSLRRRDLGSRERRKSHSSHGTGP